MYPWKVVTFILFMAHLFIKYNLVSSGMVIMGLLLESIITLLKVSLIVDKHVTYGTISKPRSRSKPTWMNKINVSRRKIKYKYTILLGFLGLLKIWEIYVICYTEEHVFVFYWYTLYIEQNITNIKYKIFRISHS